MFYLLCYQANWELETRITDFPHLRYFYEWRIALLFYLYLQATKRGGGDLLGPVHFRNAMPCDSTILTNLESNQLCNINFFQQFISKQFAARFSCSGNFFFPVAPN